MSERECRHGFPESVGCFRAECGMTPYGFGIESSEREAVRTSNDALSPEQRACRASTVACGSCEDCQRGQRRILGVRQRKP